MGESNETKKQIPRYIRGLRSPNHVHATKGRSLVICLDGTGDSFDADNSNVVHFMGCLKKDDPSQLTYYQAGIGTYNSNGLSKGFSSALDMAVASGLGIHVRDAYSFLMQNYHEGDRICIFGFSRGAFTARCLAGMLHKVGVLPAHNQAQIPFAYQIYKDDSTSGWEMSREFKRTFRTNVNVYMVGVWDSVASVGLVPRTLPLSSTPDNKPVYFRHAMAMDEHRAKFKVCRYKELDSTDDPHWKSIADIQDALHMTPNANGASATHSNEKASPNGGGAAESGRDERQFQLSDITDDHAHMHSARETNVLEVWFAGCHCDIGGGAEKNDVRHKMSQVPLRWMIRQCFDCNTGIIFDTRALANEGLDIHTLYPTYIPPQVPTESIPSHVMTAYEAGKLGPISRRSKALQETSVHNHEAPLHIPSWDEDAGQITDEHWTPERVEDQLDSRQRMNDMLATSRAWWILELMPMKVTTRAKSGWQRKMTMNLGRHRVVRDEAPKMHWTVEHRMRELGYQIPLRIAEGSEWQIVA